VADEFRSWLLPTAETRFDELLASVRFDDVANGRRGTVLVKVDAGGIPIVRTTTPYRAPAQPFRDIHDRLAQQIRGNAPCAFNNALVEHYTSAYSTMKRHSDQALDLADGSSIAVYSCYRDPRRPSRRLIVKSKQSDASFEIPLAHGSVVAFSLETNRRFTHAFVRLVDGYPRLSNGERLTLASDEQRREFFQLRRRENDETDFEYPSISYTISESDLRLPESPPLTPR
jgi:predicted nucleic acid-binding protein